MNMDDIYASNWLSADDIGDRKVTAEIENVTKETFERKEKTDIKATLTFVGYKKKLILSRTNYKSLKTNFGTDSDAWIGKKVEMYTVVQAIGEKEVNTIRVRAV